jgi:D-3-phosphoglycerate dehydrogenase
MRVIASDKFVGNAEIRVDFYNGQFINVDIETEPIEDILKESDFVTLHVPAQEGGYVIGKPEFDIMKDGVGIVNASRGGVIDEVALIDALDSGKVAFAGLDVYEDEPKPAIQVLMHTKISLTPHIGAATLEAQDRIGTELAEQIESLLKTQNS